ncbi:glycosyltransferase family 2 protein [Comamonas sp. wu1-DMT]|uniref:glycosyltransferase family 2 protein n=1 Tax=Comamonas sp. wu1-DMT TaxID=3126390 RepID=UPI0032E4C5F9
MTDMKTLVSIIMPAYNSQNTLNEAVESVLKQTIDNWELLIIVDAATDLTENIAKSWAQKDARVKVFVSPYNQGVAKSRNIGLEQAKGKYLAFLDSDDRWLSGKLKQQIKFMEETNALVSYGAYRRFADHELLNVVNPPAQVSYRRLLMGNVIGNLTGMVSRELVKDLRFLPQGHEDYIFWLQAVRRAQFAYLVPSAGPIAEYRVQKTSLSAKKTKNLSWQWKIYRRNVGLSFFHSCFFMICYIFSAIRKRII